MFRKTVLVGVSLVLAQFACSSPSSHDSLGDKVGDGMLMLVVSSVPSDVRCLVLTAVGSGGTSVRSFDVTPGNSVSLTGSGLPVGAVAISEAAFNVACSAVGNSSVPTWVSNGSATIQLVAGQPTTVSIEMVRPGQITVTNVFNDGTPDGGVRDSGISVDAVVVADSSQRLDVPNVLDSSPRLDVPNVLDSGARLDVPNVLDSSARLDVRPDVVLATDVANTIPGCTNPITFAGGQTGSFNTTDAVCYRTTASIAGWGCSNFDGRTVVVDNVPTTCGATLPARWSDGYYYFVISAGNYSYASLYFW